VAKLRRYSTGSEEMKPKCPSGTSFRKPSGLRAFLMRRNRPLKYDPHPQGQGHQPEKSVGNNFMHRFRSDTAPAGIIALRKGSPCRNIVTVDPGTDSGASQSSVASGPSITSISNSSLQDLDESEYTGEELASTLATMNSLINA